MIVSIDTLRLDEPKYLELYEPDDRKKLLKEIEARGIGGKYMYKINMIDDDRKLKRPITSGYNYNSADEARKAAFELIRHTFLDTKEGLTELLQEEIKSYEE